MIEVQCPSCGDRGSVDDTMQGARIQCRSCGQTYVAQASVAPESAPPPLPSFEDVPPVQGEPGMPIPDVAVPPPLPAEFIPPTARARAALAAAGLLLVLTGVSIWSGKLQLDLLNRASKGEQVAEAEVDRNPDITEEELYAKLDAQGLLITDEQAEANDGRQMMVVFAWLGSFVLFMVFFLMWQYRVYKNLEALETQQIRFSAGGAVGWYFCPLANLWQPCKVMNDVWIGSNPRWVGKTVTAVPGLVLLWWLVWLLDGIVGQVMYRVGENSETVDQIIAVTQGSLASDAIGVVSTALTLLLVWRVSTWQGERQALLSRRGDPMNPYAAAAV